MSWHLHLDVVLGIALLEGAYLYALRVVGARGGHRATPVHVACFSAGALVLYAGAGTPIHDLAEQRLFMMHMLQHLLFTLVAPPLLLLGMPGWLLRPAIGNRRVFRAARWLTAPLLAFMLFNVVTLVTHLPPSVDFALHHHAAHFLIHVALTGTALLMWWPVLSPLPELPRLAPPVQLIYLFVQSFIPTVLASFLTLGQTVFYRFYAEAPRTWGISARDDQLIAGLIMKLGGSAVLWIVMGVVFFAWVSREGRADRQAATAALRWEDVEQELDRMGLTKPGAR